MISFHIKNTDGEVRALEVPADINLNLMEVLKAFGYPVAATCGGMALCATCHVEVEKGNEKLPPASGTELDMIDTLPSASGCSRLACQIRLNPTLAGAVIALKSAD